MLLRVLCGLLLAALIGCQSPMSSTSPAPADAPVRLKVATFNVSMEAGNYRRRGEPLDPTAWHSC